jgi:hypothetical protein
MHTGEDAGLASDPEKTIRGSEKYGLYWESNSDPLVFHAEPVAVQMSYFVKKTVFLRSVPRLLVVANVVPSSPILITLVMKALCSSETLVLTTATRLKNPEDGILHNHLRGNLKSYKVFFKFKNFSINIK